MNRPLMVWSFFVLTITLGAAQLNGQVTSVFGRTGAVTAQSGDYTLDLIGALAGSKTIANGNFNWTLTASLTGSTDAVDINESSAGTGTGHMFGVSTLSNSTTSLTKLFQNNISTTANPGLNGPDNEDVTTCAGGSAASGTNPGGHGCDWVGTFGGQGQPSGALNSHWALLNQRNGQMRLLSGAGAAGSIGGVQNGSFLGGSSPELTYDSPLLDLVNPTLSTSSVHQQFPPLQFEAAPYRADAIGTISLGNSGGTGYVTYVPSTGAGDLVYTIANSCAGNLMEVTAAAGVITSLAIHKVNGIPVAGMYCTATGNNLSLSGGSGSGATVDILTLGSPSWGAIVITATPVTVSGASLVYNHTSTSDDVAVGIGFFGAANGGTSGNSRETLCIGQADANGNACASTIVSLAGGSIFAGNLGQTAYGAVSADSILSGGCSTPWNCANTGASSDFSNGIVSLPINVLPVITSNFTTASASLVTITGLTKALNKSSFPTTFECHLMYSEATASTAVTFGVITSGTAPTNLAAWGRADITVGSYTSGGIQGVSSTTAQNVVTVTPTATAGTVLSAEIWGTVEGAATGTPATTLAIQADIASGITLTVYRGSECRYF
jgi:hypothetical protein